MSEYRNPTPTVDIIVEVDDGIVLIERNNEPKGYALCGGFVDYGESLESAAVRETGEELNLDVRLKDLLYVYSEPDRDPRQHIITAVFVATAFGQTPKAGDDAKSCFVISLAEALKLDMVIDHGLILKDYASYCVSARRKPNITQAYGFF